jgi:hypothetical protein
MGGGLKGGRGFGRLLFVLIFFLRVSLNDKLSLNRKTRTAPNVDVYSAMLPATVTYSSGYFSKERLPQS